MELEYLFGDLLKQARLKAGMTQESLAFQAELDRTYISLLETGKRQPTSGKIGRIKLGEVVTYGVKQSW